MKHMLILLAFLQVFALCAPAAAHTSARRPSPDHNDGPNSKEVAREFSPLLWMATDEQLYPMMPHGLAFDGLDNDGNGLIDLKDPAEVGYGMADFRMMNRLTNAFTPGEFVINGMYARADSRSTMVPDNLRRHFEIAGLELSPRATERQLGGDTVLVVSPMRVVHIPVEYGQQLGPGPPTSDVGRLLHDYGFDPRRIAFAARGDSLVLVWHPAWTVGADSLRLYVEPGGYGLYCSAYILYSIVRVPGVTSRFVIRRANNLPAPVVCYDGRLPDTTTAKLNLDFLKAKPKTDTTATQLMMYWLYYLLDRGTGSHVHDGEHVFVYYDTHHDPLAVVATAHSPSNANNILVRQNNRCGPGIFPRALARHMPILVELGKHASAPDRNLDGQFDIGMDANYMYSVAWGQRDLSASTAHEFPGEYDHGYSYPRDMTGMLFEDSFKEFWLPSVRSKAQDSTGALHLDPTRDSAVWKSLSTLDKANFRKLDGALLSSRFSKDELGTYQLFPVEDMQYLVDSLLAVHATKDSVEAFLYQHRNCFWAGSREPIPDRIVISDEAFAVMLKWGARKDEKRDVWRHEDFDSPDRVFRHWLFSPLAPYIGLHYRPDAMNVRLGLQMAGFSKSFRSKTLRLTLDYDFRAGEPRDPMVVIAAPRGALHSWVVGVGRYGEFSDKARLLGHFEYCPIIYDLHAIKSFLPHQRVGISLGVHGPIDQALHDLKFEAGLFTEIPMLHDRTPIP